MSNNTTAYEILTDLEGRLEKCTHKGDTLRARCPAHEDKTPSLDITIGDSGDRVVLICRAHCTAEKVVEALGLEMRDLFATDDAWRSHITYPWLDHATGETVIQTRHVGGGSKYRWAKDTKKAALVYLGEPLRYDPDATRPIIWTEGAKAADAAASKLSADEYDVIGFPDSTTIPNAATLAKIAKGRTCVVWGDYDQPGEQAARRLVSALRQAGADDVTTIDPARLGLTAGRHDDAAEWHPRDSPGDELRAACVAAKPEEASPVPMDEAEQVRFWAEELKNEDLDGKRRILRTIKAAPVWQQLAVDMRLEVVGDLSKTEKSIATALLGRFNDLTGVWREPPGGTVDTSEPDVVSLATLLADPPELTTTVARGLAFGGTLGFIRGPKASGKTTVLAAAAARVSRGQPWAGHDTEAGTVLVVCNDDPRSWVLALRDFGADPERILTSRARVVSKPGKLAALLAEHKPTWVIIDNLRTWCRSMQLDTDNSSAAADAIDPLAEAIRDCGYPVACTIVHNEARSKGVTNDPYAGRMRNSTVFEDAADWIVGCAHVDLSTETTITAGEKTRRGIPTETLTIDLATDGHGMPTTGGGGDDPFTVKTPANPLDEKITGYLMAHPEGVSQNSVQKAVGGGRPHMVSRLKRVGTLGTDKLWRCDTGRKSPEPSQNTVLPEHGITPPEQVRPEAQIGGGENRDAVGCVSVCTANGTQGETHHVHASNPIGDTPSKRTSETHLETHLAVPDLVPLARAKVTTAPTPRGGSGAVNASIDVLIPALDVHSVRADVGATSVAPPDSEPTPVESTSSDDLRSDGAPEDRGNTEQIDDIGATLVAPTPDRSRPAPEVHSSGIKKWDDATSTWVPDDDCWLLGPTKVSLGDGLTVTDGDPGIHKPSRWTDDQWYAYEQRGMVH